VRSGRRPRRARSRPAHRALGAGQIADLEPPRSPAGVRHLRSEHRAACARAGVRGVPDAEGFVQALTGGECQARERLGHGALLVDRATGGERSERAVHRREPLAPGPRVEVGDGGRQHAAAGTRVRFGPASRVGERIRGDADRIGLDDRRRQDAGTGSVGELVGERASGERHFEALDGLGIGVGEDVPPAELGRRSGARGRLRGETHSVLEMGDGSGAVGALLEHSELDEQGRAFGRRDRLVECARAIARRRRRAPAGRGLAHRGAQRLGRAGDVAGRAGQDLRRHPLRPGALLLEDRRGAGVRGLALVRRDLPFHRRPHERMDEPERLVALEHLHRHQLRGGLAGGLEPPERVSTPSTSSATASSSSCARPPAVAMIAGIPARAAALEVIPSRPPGSGT
jgi:hypothetical protein